MRTGWTKRQLVEAWEAAKGRCWRCGGKIIHAIYGEGWVMGHAGKAHWAGGRQCLPEHVDCNSKDGREQTKLAAKAIRQRARSIGVKKKKPWPFTRQWKRKVDGTVVKR